MTVTTERITEENFSPFGAVVIMPEGEPSSEGASYRFWSDIVHYDVDGSTEIGICTVFKPGGASITGLERHLGTPEILIPIDAPFILPVLAGDQEVSQLAAFRVNIGEAVVINPGVWHGACIPANTEESSYFVIFKCNTPHEDVETKKIQPVNIGG